MNKNKAMQLIGCKVNFKRDNLLFADETNEYYDWKKGQQCKVLGYIELDGGQDLIVAKSPDFYDFEHISLNKADRELDLSNCEYPTTELATA